MLPIIKWIKNQKGDLFDHVISKVYTVVRDKHSYFIHCLIEHVSTDPTLKNIVREFWDGDEMGNNEMIWE